MGTRSRKYSLLGQTREGSAELDLARMRRSFVSSTLDADRVVGAIDGIVEGCRKSCGPSIGEGHVEAIADVFRRAVSRPVVRAFGQRGLPLLLQLYDGLKGNPLFKAQDELITVLDTFALYRCEEGMSRLADALKDGFCSNSKRWGGVFLRLSTAKDLTLALGLCSALVRRLPGGFSGLCFLRMANEMAQRGDLVRHPFDSELGKRRLKEWLERAVDDTGAACLAAISLRFLNAGFREDLVNLALQTEIPVVQVHAAFASASRGSQPAVQILADYCRKPAYYWISSDSLRQIGREDAIPKETRCAEFEAICRVCAVLCESAEFAAAPNEIAVIDSREMFWPPRDAICPVWLVKYRYAQQARGGGDLEGVGITIGNTAYVVPGVSPRTALRRIFAKYCSWEFANDGRNVSVKEAEEMLGRF